MIFRTSTTGVVADYVCRDEVLFLNQRTHRVGTDNKQIIDAMHVSLLNVADEDVAATIDAAILWTTEPPNEHPSDYNAMASLSTNVGDRHRLDVFDHVWNAGLTYTNRTSCPYGKAIRILFPNISVFGNFAYHQVPAVDWLSDFARHAQRGTDYIDNRGEPSSSRTSAAVWLGPSSTPPVESSVGDDDRSEIVGYCDNMRGVAVDDDVEDPSAGPSSPYPAAGRHAGLTLGSILEETGFPPAPTAGPWACDHRGHPNDRWWHTLRSHGCDETSTMAFYLLASHSRAGSEAAETIIENM